MGSLAIFLQRPALLAALMFGGGSLVGGGVTYVALPTVEAESCERCEAELVALRAEIAELKPGDGLERLRKRGDTGIRPRGIGVDDLDR